MTCRQYICATTPASSAASLTDAPHPSTFAGAQQKDSSRQPKQKTPPWRTVMPLIACHAPRAAIGAVTIGMRGRRRGPGAAAAKRRHLLCRSLDDGRRIAVAELLDYLVANPAGPAPADYLCGEPVVAASLRGGNRLDRPWPT
jgi:hypothetical protein